MRRFHEGPEGTLTPTGAGARPGTPWRSLAGPFLFALCCYAVAPYLGLGSRTVDPRIAEVWPPGGVGFVLLTVIWFHGRRLVGATLATMLVVFLATALLMGYPVVDSGRMALAALGQPVLMIWLYRRQLRHDGWAPTNPSQVAALLVAAAVSSMALGLVGGFPFLTPLHFSATVFFWWVLRNTVFCFVGGSTFMVLFHGRASGVLSPSPYLNRVGLLLTSVVCVYGTYLDPKLPLSWLLIIPSVWGGLTLTVRGTAYLALTVALAAAVMTYLPGNQFGYDGVLPAASIVDVLVIASTAFALLLALMREQRSSLIAELDRRGAESEAQRQLLETVFDSMSDGVMIVDRQGVTMYNAAARQLLGRPIPMGLPHSWVDTFALRGVEGQPLDEDTLKRTLFGRDEPADARTVEVLVGHENSARVLDVVAQPLGDDGERSSMVLLHDVTAQRARMRELGNFAGMVAHDLRGPLTVLDGWLEVCEDDRELDQPEVVEDALVKAREASHRMRQVIEDWLGYTVVRNGRLHPAPVRLDEVASAIVESRRARWNEGAHPEFHLELGHLVEADAGLLRQLVDNLVGNAIKYTAPDRAPEVSLRSFHDGEPGWIRVEVADRGIGIPEGQEQQIFEEFHQGPVEGRSHGTGLGLALSRRIVALHGGELSARRNPEGGSTFTFTLPEA